MSFDPTWLTDNVTIPPEHLNEVRLIREFVDPKNDNASPSELASCSMNFLAGLVDYLFINRDGGRLETIKRSNLPKAVRKQAGKLIHQLRTQGIEWEARQGKTATIRRSRRRVG